MDVHQPREVLAALLHRRDELIPDARAVHRDVEASELFDDLRHEPIHCDLVGDVAADADITGPQFDGALLG